MSAPGMQSSPDSWGQARGQACQPDCDRGRGPKTKYEIGTSPAELTTATTGSHTRFGSPTGLLADA